MTTPEERARMNPAAAVLDILGLPKPDEIIPAPADVAEIVGIPTISDITGDIAGKAKAKLRSRRF